MNIMIENAETSLDGQFTKDLCKRNTQRKNMLISVRAKGMQIEISTYFFAPIKLSKREEINIIHYCRRYKEICTQTDVEI